MTSFFLIFLFDSQLVSEKLKNICIKELKSYCFRLESLGKTVDVSQVATVSPLDKKLVNPIMQPSKFLSFRITPLRKKRETWVPEATIFASFL